MITTMELKLLRFNQKPKIKIGGEGRKIKVTIHLKKIPKIFKRRNIKSRENGGNIKKTKKVIRLLKIKKNNKSLNSSGNYKKIFW